MTSSVALLVLLVLLAAGLVWLLAGGRLSRRPEPRDVVGDHRDDDADADTLREAEDELRDVNAFTSPEEAEEDLPDWGPGAPNP